MKKDGLLLTRVFIVTLFLSIGLDILRPFLPLYGVEVGFEPTLVGFAVSIFFLASGVSRFLSGFISDRFGEYIVICLGVVVSVTGFGILIFPTLFMMGCFIIGLGAGLWRVPMIAMLSKKTDKRRLGTIFGIFTTIVEASGAIAPLIGALLIIYGYYAIFISSIIFTSSSLVFLQRLKIDQGRKEYTRVYFPREFLHNNVLKASIFSGFVGGVTIGVANSIWPIFLVDKVNADYVGVALTYTMYSVGSIFFPPFTGRLGDKLGEKRNIVLGCLLFSLSYYLFTLSRTIEQILFLEIVSALAGAFILPNLLSLTSKNVHKNEYGRFMSIYNTSLLLGCISGSVIGGILYLYNIDYPLFLCALLEATCGIVFSLIKI